MPTRTEKQRQLANRRAALRRRQWIRLAAIVLVIALLAGVALVSAGVGDNGVTDDNESAAAACGADPPADADPQQYQRPEQVLENGVDYRAIVHTSCGDIEMDLLEDRAPRTVNSFVFLARDGFFDGLIWHRVVNGFVIQTGDPDGVNGQEPDGPGYTIPDEFPKRAREYIFGTVAMANTGQPNSGGSQWFIVVHNERNEQGDYVPAGLTPTYSIFGEVSSESLETVLEIAQQEVQGGPPNDPNSQKPGTPVYIDSIEIIEA